MRNVLNYQSSEYDCGPTSLTNALRCLFDRRDVTPDILKSIALYTLDAYDAQGELGKCGTSRMAIQFLANWLNQYGKCKHFPVSAHFLQEEQVTLSPNSAITGCLQQKGVAVVHCWLGGDPHYVLLTRVTEGGIGLFDPYAIPADSPFLARLAEQDIQIVEEEPCVMNRIVKAETLNSIERVNYGMGEMETREAMLLFNTNTKSTPEKTIEFMI